MQKTPIFYHVFSTYEDGRRKARARRGVWPDQYKTIQNPSFSNPWALKIHPASYNKAIIFLLVLRREWMGMGVTGIINGSYYGSFPHSLRFAPVSFSAFPLSAASKCRQIFSKRRAFCSASCGRLPLRALSIEARSAPAWAEVVGEWLGVPEMGVPQ